MNNHTYYDLQSLSMHTENAIHNTIGMMKTLKFEHEEILQRILKQQQNLGFILTRVSRALAKEHEMPFEVQE